MRTQMGLVPDEGVVEEPTRAIRRKMNRRHLIGDHHGRVTWRATPLVRAMDGILGRHRPETTYPVDVAPRVP